METNPTTPVTDAPITVNVPVNKNRHIIPILSGVFIIVLLLVALLFFNLGKKSVEESNKERETVEFTAQNLVNEPTPTTPQQIATNTPTTPATTTKILLADAELDGYVASDGTLNNTKKIQLGRNVNAVSRGFVSFDLGTVPSGITIKAAQLRLYQESTIGTPYTVIGEVRVDHLTYGNSLDPDDYSRPALLGNIGSLSISKRIGWTELDVTNSVRDDFANARSVSQFRIHFAKETVGGDIKGDYAIFTSSETKDKNQPSLVIEYY